MSERLMLELGKVMGRQRAHDVVYEAAQIAALEKRPFAKTLIETSEVARILTAEQIKELLDPEKYTGLSRYFAETFAIKARETADSLV